MLNKHSMARKIVEIKFLPLKDTSTPSRPSRTFLPCTGGSIWGLFIPPFMFIPLHNVKTKQDFVNSIPNDIFMV